MNKTCYLQTDSRWGGLGYPKKPWYLRNCGCGEVSVSNCIIEMNQYAKYTPATIQPYCKQYAAPNGDGTYWSGIPAMMKHYGMTEVKEHATMPALFNELAKGNRVAIYLMGSRKGGSKKVHWTSGGHFVASVAYKKEGGEDWVYMKDSYSTSSLRNGWMTYRGNLKGDVIKVWSGKLNGTPTPTPVPGQLTVDGKGGKATVTAMQKYFCTKQDGVITGQREKQHQYYPALTSVKFEKKPTGSSCVKKLQAWCGVKQDGIIGRGTTAAWQKKLRDLGYLGKNETIDGYFGVKSMMAWQRFLNDNLDKKPTAPTTPTTPTTPTEPPKTEAKAYTGAYPTAAEIKTASNVGIRKDICEWARKIAADNRYHYNKWNSKEPQSKKCPICTKLSYSKDKKHFGWNCIGFCFAAWHHGGGIPCKCNCSVTNDDEVAKMYKASDASALATAKKLIGINDITMIKSKSEIPQSKLQMGDICYRFSGNTFKHVWLYLGGGQMADSRGSNGKVANNDQISVRKAQTCKIVIRYTGGRTYLSKGDEGPAVTMLQNYLDWYFKGEFFKKCGKADGKFGKNTEEWTKKMQADFFGAKDADGLVGAKTFAKMKEVKR